MSKIRIIFLLCILPILGCLGQKNDTLITEIKKTKIAIYPAIGYTPETKLNLGVIGFFVFNKGNEEGHSYYRPSSFTPFIIYTTNGQFLLNADWDNYFKNGTNLNLVVRYFNFPDFYYGIGNDTDPNIKEQYTNNFFRMEGRLMKPLNSKIFAGVLFDFQANNIKKIVEGGLLATDQPTGIEGGRNMGIGPAFAYDTRNSTLYPTKGKFFQAGLTFFGSTLVGEYNYTRYLFDYRQYFEFLGPKNIVAFQFRADLTSGRDIPFYKLNTIAGGGRLRGFAHKNLYRDRQSVFFQVEGRQHLFWRFGGVVFAGVGSVFNSFEQEFKSEYVRFVFGFGGRFQAIKDEKLNIRMDLGFTDNGQSAFFLSVREAF